MNSRHARVVVFALAWAHAGCSQVHRERGSDSSTHWLLRCERDDQCGGLSCTCGVCSKRCEEDTECSELGAAGACLAASADECGEARQICDRSCQRDTDCRGGVAAACVDGHCREALVSVDAGGGTSAGDAGSQASTAEGGSSVGAETGNASTLPAECRAQDAAGSDADCVTLTGYAWNGASCQPVWCGCRGEDCDALEPTQAACEAKHAACHPESTCEYDWYKCPDVCPQKLVLDGGGRSFGECSGDCSFELSLWPVTVLDIGTCDGFIDFHASLRIHNTDGSERVVNMELTGAASEEMALISLALQGAQVAPITGCPDCADGGAAYITRGADKFSYPFRAPPEALRAADRFVQDIIDQGRHCSGAALASCETIESATD